MLLGDMLGIMETGATPGASMGGFLGRMAALSVADQKEMMSTFASLGYSFAVVGEDPDFRKFVNKK